MVGGAAAWGGINYGLEQPTPQIEKLQAQIEEVAANTGQAEGADVSALTAKLDDLDARLAEATTQAADGGGVAESEVAALQSGVSEVQARLEALESASPASGADEAQVATLSDGLDQLGGRLDALESTLAAGGAAAEGGDAGAAQAAFAAIQSQVDALTTKVEEIESGAGAEGDAGTAQVAALSDQIDSLKSEIDGRLEGLSGRVDGVQGGLSGLAEQTKALSGRLDALEAEMKSTQKRIDEVSVERNNAATIALAASQVRQAIITGEPYAAELETLAPVAGKDPVVAQALDGLQPAAADGVATMAELRQTFHDLANEIVHAANAPDGDNLLDRATGNLMRLVSVRQVGQDVEGQHPEAVVARTEAMLNADDLEGALTELDAMEELPEPAVAWRERAEARLSALKAEEQLEDHATDLLAKARS